MAQPFRASHDSMLNRETVSDASAIDVGRSVLEQEARALQSLAEELDGESFHRAVSLLHACRGNVIVSGMGKAGLIAQKIAATLASTGTPSHFLHPAEAIHGDLGRVQRGDVAVILSHSGETEEVVRLLPSLAFSRVPVLAITGRESSRLAQDAAITLCIGSLREAGSLALAPTTSTTAMLALGDALAVAVSQRKRFTPEDFARYHPGGSLGRQLSRVEEVMRPLNECRVAGEDQTVREVFVSQGKPGRRSGAILVTNAAFQLVGIFTDSDLARLLESQRDSQLDQPIASVMTRNPVSVVTGTLLPEAIRELRSRKISELPVVDHNRCPNGLIDITDVVACMPSEATESEFDSTREPANPAPHSDTEADDESNSLPRIISLPNRKDVNT